MYSNKLLPGLFATPPCPSLLLLLPHPRYVAPGSAYRQRGALHLHAVAARRLRGPSGGPVVRPYLAFRLRLSEGVGGGQPFQRTQPLPLPLDAVEGGGRDSSSSKGRRRSSGRGGDKAGASALGRHGDMSAPCWDEHFLLSCASGSGCAVLEVALRDEGAGHALLGFLEVCSGCIFECCCVVFESHRFLFDKCCLSIQLMLSL